MEILMPWDTHGGLTEPGCSSCSVTDSVVTNNAVAYCRAVFDGGGSGGFDPPARGS